MERNELQVLNELEMLLNHAVEIDSSGIYRIVKNAFELLKEQGARIEQLNRFVNGFSRDAMPIVRCKDCKHYRINTAYPGTNMIMIYCAKTGIAENKSEWFCADGERG